MGEKTRNVVEYYECLDHGEYDRLEGLLAPGFVHERPDGTLEGRDTFVAFMRDRRPRFDTEHTVRRIFEAESDGDTHVFAAEGDLRTLRGDRLFGFVDVHELEDEQVRSIRTYTH